MTSKSDTLTTNGHQTCDWDELDGLGAPHPCNECGEPVPYGTATCSKGHDAFHGTETIPSIDDPEWTPGKGGPGKGTPEGPSEAQVGYFKSLMVKLGCEDVDALVKTLLDGKVSRRKFSELIDTAKADLAKAPKAALSAKANRYGGKCVSCGQYVEAEAGVLIGKPGAWAVAHSTDPADCPSPKVAAPEPEVKADAPEGMHRTEDGTIYKVQIAHHGSHRPYAKKLVVDGNGEAHFDYAQGAVRKLSAATLMSLEEAKAFGALYGVCCRCAATLTDEGSIAAGIGPICAGKFEF